MKVLAHLQGQNTCVDILVEARPSVELKAQSINEGMHSKDGPSPVTRNRNQLTKMPSHRDQNMKVLRPWSLVLDGKDPPCIRDTIRDVQRHMGASTWVKSVEKSVKITSRKLMDTCHFRPFGRR